MRNILTVMAISAAALVPATGAIAQSGTLSLQLNKASSEDSGCFVTYVATNGTGVDLDSASYEVAVFDIEGEVDQLLLLPFGPLGDGKTKVFRFAMSESGCDSVARVLINDVNACSAADGAEIDCLSMLETSTRTEIAFGL